MGRYRDILGRSPKEWLDSHRFSVIILPILIFFALTSVILLASVALSNSTSESAKQSVISLANEDGVRAAAQLRSYGLLTTSFAGLIQNGYIDNENWSQYISAFEVEKNYPSLYATGFRQQPNPTTTTRSYVYPMTAEAPSLTEFSNNDNRKTTITEAARTGQTLMTPLLVTRDDGALRSILYIFTPAYSLEPHPSSENERLARYLGVVFVAFDANTFFDQLYRDDHSHPVHLNIYQENGSQRVSMFQKGTKPQIGALTHTQTLDLFGQKIVYAYTYSVNTLSPSWQRSASETLPILGIVFSLIFAITVSLQMHNRSKRLSASREKELLAAKDDLLSLASHQLRTPATGVKQYLGMVLQGFAGDVTPQQKELLDEAYQSNERQLHIINDVLHLARLESERIILSKTRCDLVALIRSSLGELSHLTQQASIKLRLKLPKKAYARVDPHIVKMIIENLLTNAIKYTNTGGKVTVTLVKSSKNYIISVADTGVGIDQKNLDKLFVPFSRIPNSRSAHVSGTGVGLYLAKSFARLHAGDVTVVSVPKKGSTFTFTLPSGL